MGDSDSIIYLLTPFFLTQKSHVDEEGTPGFWNGNGVVSVSVPKGFISGPSAQPLGGIRLLSTKRSVWGWGEKEGEKKVHSR